MLERAVREKNEMKKGDFPLSFSRGERKRVERSKSWSLWGKKMS